MAGNVYLRTNRFEVKLEAITFKTRDFEYLCKMDFLFPHGKVWDRRPIVGLDVMRHPRDPSVLLVLLCFGVGCVILRFLAGEPLPPRIHKFLSDERIHFVGFGIPEKRDMFPFGELGLNKNEVDIGYLAAKILKQPKCKTWELSELARKVLGIKRMIGLTEASSFERHEQIKTAICQLFITSVIAMGLLVRTTNDKKKSFFLDGGSNKKSSFFLKNLSSLHLLAEGWFKQHHSRGKHKTALLDLVDEEEKDSIDVEVGEMEEDALSRDDNNNDDDDDSDSSDDDDVLVEEFIFGSSADEKTQPSDPEDDLSSHAKSYSEDDSFASNKVKEPFKDRSTNPPCPNRKALKGILKCPSSKNLAALEPVSKTGGGAPRRANSKGCNVTFKCDE